ncbi:ABC transporter permease [Nitratifractor sp.]|uniref:ABC transporter permease n=1 Tax=Nitratifractor sp. TaxID=2268144 RepID=UPI0025D11B1C|nr:ABC transporter permease [Nitratifractor sp.]
MFTQALKALQANRMRSLLIFLSLTVSVTAVFLISAVAHGIVSSYSTILRSDGDLIVTQAKISDTFFSDVDTALIPRIARIPGVRRVTAMIVGASPAGKLPIVAVYGLSGERMKNYRLLSGHYPKRGEVLVGRGIAGRFGSENRLQIGDRKFRISGVFGSETGFESGGVILTLSDAGKLFHKKASMLFVDLDKTVPAQKVMEAIRKLSDRIEVKSTDAFVKNYHQFRIIETSADVISLIALLMGLISIASIMSVTMLERKYEFGILRALGYGRGSIVGRILTETLILGIFSYLSALAAALGILWVLRHLPALQGYVDGVITPALAAEVGIAALTMTVLGAILPAWRASGIDPMELITRGSRA